MKNFIDISTEEKIKEVYNLFDNFKKLGDIYSFYNVSDNSANSKYIKNIAKQINFDLNIYKERRSPKRHCLYCGKELHYGQKKFCSNSCSASFNNKLRESMSEETRKKISNTLKLKNKEIQNEQNKKFCLICGKELTGRKKSYCSKECSQQRNKIFYKTCGILKKCEFCGKEFIGRVDRKFCSNNCSRLKRNEELLQRFLNNEYLNNGNSTLPNIIREFLYEKSNYKCDVCGYEGYNIKTNKTILQIHHIDGNSKNNSPNNLQVICPNCHAKTENYMGLNKGKSGRDKRYKK